VAVGHRVQHGHAESHGAAAAVLRSGPDDLDSEERRGLDL
jgi:hypothetical protein